MGHVVVSAAADTAVELAAEAGFAWVGVRGSNHAGPGALYAAMPLEHDMIGLYGAVASANHMPPWGSSERLLGTNPLAIAIPAGAEPPVVLDIATTVVSYGTIKKFALRGEPMPAGWVVGLDGQPITDAEHAHNGVLLPISHLQGQRPGHRHRPPGGCAQRRRLRPRCRGLHDGRVHRDQHGSLRRSRHREVHAVGGVRRGQPTRARPSGRPTPPGGPGHPDAGRAALEPSRRPGDERHPHRAAAAPAARTASRDVGVRPLERPAPA